eukprot:3210649-Pleurochrysis_carterae.AAC.3
MHACECNGVTPTRTPLFRSAVLLYGLRAHVHLTAALCVAYGDTGREKGAHSNIWICLHVKHGGLVFPLQFPSLVDSSHATSRCNLAACTHPIGKPKRAQTRLLHVIICETASRLEWTDAQT